MADKTTIRDKLRLNGWRLWVLLVILLYTGAGFLLAPILIEKEIVAFSEERMGVQARLDQVRVNPYLLTVSLDGFSSSDQDLGELLSFDSFLVDFQASSLFRWAWTFKTIRFDNFRFRPKRLEDGRFSASILMERLANSGPETELPAEPATDTPVRLIIQNIDISSGRIDFSDLTRTPDYHGALGPMSLSINDFSTLPEHAGATTFEARFPQGGLLTWQGSVGLNPVRSQGRLEIRETSLVRPWEYMQEEVAFEVTDGALELGADYELLIDSDELEFRVEDGFLTVRNLSLKGLTEDTEILAIDALDLSGARFNLQESSASIDEIRLAGGGLETWLNAGGELNLSEIFSPVNAGSTDNVKPDDVEESPAQDSDGVELSIASILLEDFNIAAADRGLATQASIEIQPLTATIQNYSTQPGSRFDFDVKADIASGGLIALSGQAALEPLDVEADLDVSGLSIVPAQPYAAESTRLILKSGDLAAAGKIASNGAETLSYEGRVSMSSFSSLDGLKQERFLSWADLALENLQFALDKRNLSIGSVVATEPFGRIAIAQDGRVNIQDLFSTPETDDPSAAPSVEPETPGTADDQPFDVFVGRITIDKGETDFSDLSLPLPFAARVHTMDGKVSAFSTEQGAPAGLDFEGTVNEFGSSSVKGKLDPFAPQRQADLNVSFKNVDMSSLTPYTAKFGGYRIDGGKLSLDIQYVIEEGQLNSGNRIIIDNLVLGEKVESPDSMNLPLKLAVALLRDSDGRIDLDLPVTGNVNDPEFHYGKLVVKVLGNVLKKLITAPFHFLANLVGADGDDFQYVSFQPGTSEVPPPAQENLAKLAGALAERPQLTLALSGTYDPTLDGTAIQKRKLDELIQQRLENDMPRGDYPIRKTLEALFDDFYGQEAREALKLKHTGVQAEDPAEKSKPVLDETAYVDELRARLEENQAATNEELVTLGEARAVAVQQALLGDGAMAEDRIALQAAQPVEKSEETEVRMELAVSTD
ncbi:MAG: DUF748 domain-containing protein [Gammaproteobacteria bacterium]